MNSTQEAKALQQMFAAAAREFEGRLLPMSVVYPSLAKSPRSPAPELPQVAKLALWRAAIKLLLANSTFVEKSMANAEGLCPLREARDEDAA